MCGLAGIIHKSPNLVLESLLFDMANVISHRGPDGEGTFVEGPVGFAHKMLSIIDLVHGAQPMHNGDLTIVFNGEIYNYIELRDSLRKAGVAFKTQSDTEVILKLFEAHGLDSIPMLNGMFAFLLYDRRTQTLVAARDHFGIKPLYYFEDESHFLFASEIKSLLQHPAVKASPNYRAMQDYLTFQYVLGEETLFENIFKVLPGHYITIDLRSFESTDTCYWEPNFKIDHHHTESYFIHHLQEILENTVSMQMRSDVPVGAYLSGGLDSSVVTMLASKHTHDPFHTFTGAFHEGPEYDETPYARDVAAASNSIPHEIYPTALEFVDLLPKLIYHLDEPVAGPGLFPQYIVSKLASQHVKVVLGGQGGDEIFGGYTRYVVAYLEQAIKGAIFESNDEGEHIVSLSSILPNLTVLQTYIPMMKKFWANGAFEEMDRRYFSLIDRSTGALNLYSGDFQHSFDREQVFSRFQKLFNHPDTLSYFNKMTHFDMVSSLPALLQVEDRVSMAVSLESRVPLLDKRIVDMVSTMPAGMKFKGGQMKYLLKKAVRHIVPKSINDRKDKMGFPVPLHLWAKKEASGFIRDILLSKACRERGIFDSKRLETLIESEQAFGRNLWGAICLELWFREFVDG